MINERCKYVGYLQLPSAIVKWFAWKQNLTSIFSFFLSFRKMSKKLTYFTSQVTFDVVRLKVQFLSTPFHLSFT